MVYKHPGIDLVNLRNDINEVIKSYKAEKKYRACLQSLEFNDTHIRETVIVGLDIDLDNKLRNYAYEKEITPSKRIDHFLTKTLAKHILEEYPQRPEKNDKHAQRWKKYCNRKRTENQEENKKKGGKR